MGNGFNPNSRRREDTPAPLAIQPAAEGAASTFAVTVTVGDRPRRFLWNSAEPLALNHPPSLLLEARSEGIQIVHLDDSLPPIAISEEEVDSGSPIPLEGLRIQVRRIRKARAAFLPRLSRGAVTSSSSDLYVSSGFGEAFLNFRPFKQSTTVRIGGRKIARFGRVNGGIRLEALVEGVTVSLDEETDPNGDPIDLEPRKPRVVSGITGSVFIIRLGPHWWRLGQTIPPVVLGVENTPLLDRNDKEAVFFSRSLQTLVASFAIFTFLLWTNIVPRPKPTAPTEIASTTIQLRKIIKKPPPKKEEPKPMLAKAPEPTPPPKPKKEEKKLAETPKKAEKKQPKKIAKAGPKPKPIQQKPAPAPKAPTKMAKKGPPAPAPKGKMVALPTAPHPPPKRDLPTPAQIQAAQAQARLSKSLGFLSAGPKGIAARNIVAAAVPNMHTKYQVISSATVPSAQAGGGYLSKVASSVGGNGMAAINTRNARGIASDAGVVGGYGPGGKGKALNEVQGKVSLAALYDPNAGDGVGSSLGGGGLSLSGEGKMNESLLMKILEKYMQKFQYCYEKALLTNSSLAGNLLLQWTINPGGQASHVKVIRSQLNNAALHQCVSRELAKVPFPSPQGGSVTVKFPFAFSSSAL